jgi:hypothetical protein
MAGLSMGGAHTIRFGLPRADLFRYVGIFSMGLGMQNPKEVTEYEAANAAGLQRAAQPGSKVTPKNGKIEPVAADASQAPVTQAAPASTASFANSIPAG